MPRWMPLLALVVLPACGGAEADVPSEPASTQLPVAEEAPPQEPEDERAPPPAEAASFQLEWRRGSGAVFLDQVSIRDDGQFVWVASVSTPNAATMRAVMLQLDEAEVRAVRAAIESADVFALPGEPDPSSVSDGTQLTLRLRVGDREHHVRTEEPLSEGVQRLHDTVVGLMTDDRRAELAAAPEAQPEDFDPSLILR